VLLAPGGCHSNLRFLTRGSVIGGESISLRAFAVINQTAVFVTARRHDCGLVGVLTR
jgi:hypothetical protein